MKLKTLVWLVVAVGCVGVAAFLVPVGNGGPRLEQSLLARDHLRAASSPPQHPVESAVPPKNQTETILVASDNIVQGEKMDEPEKFFRQIEVPQGQRVGSYLQDLKEIPKTTLLVALNRGEYVPRSMFGDEAKPAPPPATLPAPTVTAPPTTPAPQVSTHTLHIYNGNREIRTDFEKREGETWTSTNISVCTPVVGTPSVPVVMPSVPVACRPVVPVYYHGYSAHRR